MNLQICPHCGLRINPSSDGLCPSCGNSVDLSPIETPTDNPVAEVVQAVSADNPYQSPVAVDSAPEPTTHGKVKEPFSHQAAKFSAYAPFILFLMGFCVQGQLRAHQGCETGSQLAMVLGVLCWTTSAAALIFGVVGLCGGISRRAVGTIVYSIIGLILNAGYIALWVSVLLFRTQA